MQITGTTNIWLTSSSTVTPKEIKDASPAIVGKLHYSDAEDMEPFGWTKVGTATITADLVSIVDLVDNKVTSLRAEAQRARSDAQIRCNAIELQISKLLAIADDSGSILTLGSDRQREVRDEERADQLADEARERDARGE